MAVVTGGIAPGDYAGAWWDWFWGLTKSPSTRTSLLMAAWQGALDNLQFAAKAASTSGVAPAPDDPRFKAPAWSTFPFNIYAHSFKNWESWWKLALGSVPGVPARSSALVNFVGRQMFELASPDHSLLTNPELLEETRAEAGKNLLRGLENWLEDTRRLLQGEAPVGTEGFQVGATVATTPGKVIFRNRLVEVIQYTPQTPDVQAEPVLITPAWIMKYYILDLSPANSMVRYLVEKGHTVFMISWKNPDETDRALGMDDYVTEGFCAALDAVSAVVPQRKVHTVGYCIGGTLLSIAAAYLAGEGDTRIGSVTLLAAQTDFSEPGELSLFISPRQLAMLEAVMHKEGVLSSEKMAGSFVLLRSRDLLWTPFISLYVHGKREPMNDLMAWNADGTRMPWKMHSEYLYRLYLDNELAHGDYTVNGKTISLSSLTVPMFVVGTESDHVAPWPSVYKARGLTRSSDYTFLLTSSGHNAGIISGPSHPRRRHHVLTWHDAATSVPQADWEKASTERAGSWWPTWETWLTEHSTPERVAPPTLGDAARGYPVIADAPGEYVRKK